MPAECGRDRTDQSLAEADTDTTADHDHGGVNARDQGRNPAGERVDRFGDHARRDRIAAPCEGEDDIRAGAGREDNTESARAADSDQTCPHARPTRVRFTLADLERAFHRR